MSLYGKLYKIRPEFANDRRLATMRKTLRDVYKARNLPGPPLGMPSKGLVMDALAHILGWVAQRPRDLEAVSVASKIDRLVGLDGFAFAMSQADLMTVFPGYVRFDLTIAEPVTEDQNQ